MNSRLINDKGFSLIEVLIAIAIFSIVILAINSLQVRNVRSGSDSRRMTEATYFANAKMEELIGLPYDHDDLQDGDSDSLDNTGTDADENETMGSYQVSWNIAEDDIIEGSKTIRVIALFDFNEDASNGDPARIVLQRIVSR
ncbi:MAG: type IV pilus modification PilV family protein [Candidatus Muiribacteriota bacterium]